GQGPSPSPTPVRSPRAALAGGAWQDSEARQQAQLFEEVSQTFDRRTGWVALAGGDGAEMGLLSEPVAGEQRLLLLRLTLWRGGREVSQTDMAILAGQSAELRVPLGGGRVLHYRLATSAEQVSKLSIWAELTSPHKPNRILAALANQLYVRERQVLEAGDLVSRTGAYELRVSVTQQEIDAS
ncbi:MAG: hypothetical protein ACLFV3_11250, partial [Phycisphaeraceae bacterium]